MMRLTSLIFLSLMFVYADLAFAKESVTWLRVKDRYVTVGPQNEMQGGLRAVVERIAEKMPEYTHHYKIAPLKRAWFLVGKQGNETNTYCFYNAAVTDARKQWGYYSQPTVVTFPYPAAALKGTLDAYVEDGYVSAEKLLASGHRTVILDQYRNEFSNLMRALEKRYPKAFVHLHVASEMDKQTALIIKSGRIHFGNIAGSVSAVRAMGKRVGADFQIYDLLELKGKKPPEGQVLCSKTPMGKKVVEAINRATTPLLQNTAEGRAFRDIQFDALQYEFERKAKFNELWQRAFFPSLE